MKKASMVFLCTFLITCMLHAQAKLGSGKLVTVYASDTDSIKRLKSFEYVGFVADLLHIEYRNDSATLYFSYAIFGGEGRINISEKTDKGFDAIHSLAVPDQKSGIISFTVQQKDMMMLRIEVFIFYKKQPDVFYDSFSCKLTQREKSHL